MTKKIIPLSCVQVDEEEISDIENYNNNSECKCSIKKCCYNLWCGKFQITAVVGSLLLLLVVIGGLSLWVRIA